MPHLCGRPLPGTRRCNLGRETAIQKVEWRDDDWLYLADSGNDPKVEVSAPSIDSFPFPKLPDRLPFVSPHYATPRGPSNSVIRKTEKLTLKGRDSLESNFNQSMLARRLTHQSATATSKLSFEPENFQQMAGMAAYYNTYLFHYLYLSNDEDAGLSLQIHSCNDGESSFPLGSEVVPVSKSKLFSELALITRICSSPFLKMGKTFGNRTGS